MRASPRWAWMEGFQVSTNGHPFLDRLRVVQTPWFGIYLHRIHEPDPDRDPHDHPWPFISLILSGSYEEVTFTGPQELGHYQLRKRGSAHFMSTRKAHRITDVQGILWTLVLTGPRIREWGFWTDEGWLHWRDYNQRKAHRP